MLFRSYPTLEIENVLTILNTWTETDIENWYQTYKDKLFNELSSYIVKEANSDPTLTGKVITVALYKNGVEVEKYNASNPKITFKGDADIRFIISTGPSTPTPDPGEGDGGTTTP